MAYTTVVGVNDSIPSHVAVSWAATRVAMRDDAAELVLVHVLGVRPDLPKENAEKIRTAAEIMLHGVAAAAMQAHPLVRVRTVLAEGNLIDEMLATAADAALLVVGTHKTGFIRGRSIGSLGLRVAAQARIPVAVVPESAHRSRSGIMVGVDESAGGRDALEFAADEAEHTGQEITLIRAWEAPRSVGVGFETTGSDLDRRYAADAGQTLAWGVDVIRRGFPNLVTQSRRVRRPVAEALLDSAASARVLVLGETRARNGIAPLGEVAHDVLLNLVGPTILVHSPVPVLEGPEGQAVQAGKETGR